MRSVGRHLDVGRECSNSSWKQLQSKIPLVMKHKLLIGVTSVAEAGAPTASCWPVVKASRSSVLRLHGSSLATGALYASWTLRGVQFRPQKN